MEEFAELTGHGDIETVEDAERHASWTGWNLFGVAFFVALLVSRYGVGMPFWDSVIIAVGVGGVIGLVTRLAVYWLWLWVFETEHEEQPAPVVVHQQQPVQQPVQRVRQPPQPVPRLTAEPRMRENTITLGGISVNTYQYDVDEATALLDNFRQKVLGNHILPDQISLRALHAADISRHDNSNGPSSAKVLLEILEANDLVAKLPNGTYELNERGQQAFPVRVLNVNGEAMAV